MKNIRNIISYLFLLSVLLCFESVEAANSEAEYKKLSKTFILNEDGRQEMNYSMELTLFTHTAMNGTYGETFVVYNPNYQELKINSSYTKQKDGKIIKTPNNAFIEVLPAAAANAPAYNHLKEMVIVHTGLELGATIYLDYSLISKPGYQPEIDVYEELLQSSPVKEYVISIQTPESKELLYEVTNSNVKPTVKTHNGTKKAEWKFRNLPAISKDRFVSVAGGDLPYLSATTLNTTSDILAVLTKQFDSTHDSQLQTIAEELCKGAQSDIEKIKRIQDYVIGIDNNRLSMEQTGYKLRPASAVIETAYGTEAEKVKLLYGLLKESNIDAQPIAIYKTKADKVQTLKAIEHLYIECKANGKKYYLSTSSSQPVILPSGVAIIGVKDGNNIESGLTNDAIKSEVSIAWKDNKPTATIDEFVSESLLPLGIAANSSNTVVLPIIGQNNTGTLVLPESSKGLSTLGYGMLNSIRENNIAFPRMIEESYKYSIELPAESKIDNIAKSIEIDNAAGSYKMSLQKDNEGRVNIMRQIKLNKKTYSTKEYKELRALLNEWHDVNQRTLIVNSK